MPSIRMKTKLSTGCSRGKDCLGVCQKSSMISKKACSHIPVSRKIAECDVCTQIRQDDYVLSSMEMHSHDSDCHEGMDQQESLDEGDSQFQKQPLADGDSGTISSTESSSDCMSNFETIFSPSLQPTEIYSVPHIADDAGSNGDLSLSSLGVDNSDESRHLSDYQACNVSDFFISEMIIPGLPFDGNMVDDDFMDANIFPDYKSSEPSMLLDMAEESMILPLLEDTGNIDDHNDVKSCEETKAMTDPDSAGLYTAINQIKSCNQESGLSSDPDQAEDFDPQFFIKELPELSDVVANFQPSLLPKDYQSRKSVTLVLDLDETLVHSMLEPCDDADFTFTVFFNMKEHIVYVKQRPHLHKFLERVAELFEVVIFTASQSIYAEQLLDILDSQRKLISRRVYRESCIFSDGGYTKDLTVLGVDLAKVAIIDNSPQVFRLQVNNGIPIKSWFDDPSDCALISLLPFLETLVDADDVRPIIAKRFGNKE